MNKSLATSRGAALAWSMAAVAAGAGLGIAVVSAWSRPASPKREAPGVARAPESEEAQLLRRLRGAVAALERDRAGLAGQVAECELTQRLLSARGLGPESAAGRDVSLRLAAAREQLRQATSRLAEAQSLLDRLNAVELGPGAPAPRGLDPDLTLRVRRLLLEHGAPLISPPVDERDWHRAHLPLRTR